MTKNRNIKKAVKKVANKNRIILVIIKINNLEEIQDLIETFEENIDAICIYDSNADNDGPKEKVVHSIEKYLKTTRIPFNIKITSAPTYGETRTLYLEETKKFTTSQQWSLDKTYAVILNEDEQLFIDGFNKDTLTESGYNLVYFDYNIKGHQLKLFNLNYNWKCIGIIEDEWIISDNKEQVFPKLEDTIYIENNVDDSDDNVKYKLKLSANKEILIKELEKNPDNAKNVFLLAELYNKLDNQEEALTLYTKRTTMIGSAEDLYYSYLRIAECSVDLVLPEEKVHDAYMKCINLYPFMLEPIYNLMYFYSVIEDWKTAFEIGKLGLNITSYDDIPFKVEYDIYDYRYKKDMLTLCYHTKNYGIGVKLGSELLLEKKYEDDNDDSNSEIDEDDENQTPDEIEEDIRCDYEDCLKNITNKELNIPDKIEDINDIKVILLSKSFDDKLVKKIADFKTINLDLMLCLETNQVPDEYKNLLIDVDLSEVSGWSSTSSQLMDKATYYSFKNKHKYVWLVDETVEYGADLEKLKKLIIVDTTDDLIAGQLSEDSYMLDELLDKKVLKNITVVESDWISTLNGICRVSYLLLTKLNEFRLKDKRLYDDMYLFPTLCNKHNELSICYLTELDMPIYVHKRNNKNLTDIEKNILLTKDTYNLYISIMCFHKKSQNELPRYWVLNKETNTMVDEFGKNINIAFDDNIKLSNADQKMIKALRNKNITVDIKEVHERNYHFVFKQSNYSNMSNVLRQLLEKLADSTERLEFLRDFFKGEDMVILGGGPSTGHLTESEMNYIFDNHLTICVKYVLDILKKKKKSPTFFVFNQYVTTNTLPHYKNLSKNITSIFGSDGNYKHKNNGLMLLKVDDVHFCIRNFNNLLMNHVDCLTWKSTDNNQRTYINMHIMCEIALPLCIHLGIANIYTTGWDLKLINNQDYCYESNTKSYLNSKISEYKYVPNIRTILNNLGITIHKIKESPVLLELKNIFPQ